MKFNEILKSDALNQLKNGISDVSKKVSGEIKTLNENFKEAKAPVEGAIIRYSVIYLSGLAKYPKKRSGEIGLNIMPKSFYLKPTQVASEWFEDMVIPYDKINDFKIIKRTVSLSEGFLSERPSELATENNIEISFIDEENNEQVIRLEMLTGISVHGQAVKCKEMLDILRQNQILSIIQKQSGDKAQSKSEDVFAQLEKLASLKEKGIISEEEFLIKKNELMQKM